VKINNRKVKVGDEVNGRVLLDRSMADTELLVLKKDDRFITFDLLVQHTGSPGKNKLSYFLEGLAEEWIEESTGRTSVTFTNLPPGDYKLLVKGANGDGVWTDDPLVLNMHVLTPWYSSRWAISLYFLFAALIAVLISRYFIKLDRLSQRLLYEQKDKKRIDEINQAKLLFFTNISHEFRTPLTLIKGPLDKLRNKTSPAERRKYLNIIDANANRLLNLIDQLLAFRKAEQGHLELQYDMLTLGDFLYPITEAFESYSLQKNIHFHYKVHRPEETIAIDFEKMEWVLFNLLSNAFRYVKEHGTVSLEGGIVSSQGADYIHFKVSDNGKGIAPENLGKVFRRFYQIKDTGDKRGGTGIGLAFSKSIVELHGGTINVVSDPDHMTTFRVELPNIVDSDKCMPPRQSVPVSRISELVPDHNVWEKINGVSGIPGQKHTGLNICLADDDEEIRNFLVSELGEKYHFLLAEDGSSALDIVRSKTPDLVISDVMMPEMDGFQSVEVLKSDLQTCHIPVILLTALGEDEHRIKGIEYGADAYLSKPFSIDHLEVRIKKLIENKDKLKQYFSQYNTQPAPNISINTVDQRFIKNLAEAIEKHMADSAFGVDELAREVGMSSSQLYRKMKQLIGEIPNAYLRNYRLQRAADLFKQDPGLHVSEVMYQVGIESASYFTRAFKKRFGVAPSEYVDA
jgi:signal transduction histidine kinase/DNA-binding response OmpR family regulator